MYEAPAEDIIILIFLQSIEMIFSLSFAIICIYRPPYHIGLAVMCPILRFAIFLPILRLCNRLQLQLSSCEQ